MTQQSGIVFLIGAGPGDPGLITVRGLSLLREADVVVYDRLVDRALLAEAPASAERIDVGKRPGDAPVSQSEINQLLIDRARQGHRVVRLKGGDPFVFGRGFEELSACREAGIPCVVIPGVSSAVAAPELAGIPLTLRGISRSFAVLTAETAPDTNNAIDFSQIRGVDTLVILMGRARLAEISRTLIENGWAASTPVACVQQASTPHHREVRGTLATIAALADQSELAAPMVTIIGQVAAHAVSCAGYSESAQADKLREESRRLHAGDSAIAGKRILITRPRQSAQRIARKIEAAGGLSIVCPLLRIAIPRENPQLDSRIADLGKNQWVAFTSPQAVTAFWRRLVALGQDARHMTGCRIAALGFATAKALRRRGISPDATARDSQALAAEMISQSAGSPGRVLWPRGDRAMPTLREKLLAAGAELHDPIVYRTELLNPSPESARLMREGIDAVLFYSPSAAVQFAALELPAQNAMIICMGRATADAARNAGLRVDATAADPTDDGMIAALQTVLSVGWPRSASPDLGPRLAYVVPLLLSSGQ